MDATLQIAQENELQTRLRIVSNHFKERDNCIVLKVDTHLDEERGVNPFGFHFELDREKLKEKRKEIRREELTRWLAWLAILHHRLGLRHVLLLLLMTLYLLMGGAIFLAIEQASETERYHETIKELAKTTVEAAEEVANTSLTTANATERAFLLAEQLAIFYKRMLSIEGRYSGSTFHLRENIELNRVWTFSNAVFYALTIFSTIGYGSIACATWTGRWATIAYGIVGIPLMLLTLGDLGQVAKLAIARTACVARRIRDKCRRRSQSDLESGLYLDEEGSASSPRFNFSSDTKEEFTEEQPPLWLVLLIIGLYFMATSAFVWLFDYDDNGERGIDFQESFYFVFISVSTIGFGDVMPKNIQYSAVMALAFLLGLVLASLLNGTVFAAMYAAFDGGVRRAEEGLERIHRRKASKQRHGVFARSDDCGIRNDSANPVPPSPNSGHQPGSLSGRRLKSHRSRSENARSHRKTTPWPMKNPSRLLAAPSRTPSPLWLGRPRTLSHPMAPSLGAFGCFDAPPQSQGRPRSCTLAALGCQGIGELRFTSRTRVPSYTFS